MKVLVLFIGFAILLAVTNPTAEDFREWMQQEISSQVRQQWYGGIVDIASVTGLDRHVMDHFMRGVTRNDYVVFSIYSFRMDNQTYRILGIGGNFFSIESTLR